MSEQASGAAPAGRGSIFHRLYTGTGAFDIVGKRKRFYIGFGLLVVVCIVSIAVRGFNFGIEFTGGTSIQMPAQGAHGVITVDEAKQAFRDGLGRPADVVQSVGSGNSATIQIRTDKLTRAESAKVEKALFDELQPLGTDGKPSAAAISDSAVTGTWGGEISRQALIALLVFLALVSVFLAIYFERWMAVAAMLALGHDIVVTAGIYSIVGFEVTPATVIGLLTILGYSLYDTVVVFDKVRENTRGLLGLTRRTYPEAANLALNQTLMRSINTSLIALLPVLGLLVVGVGVLGVGTLQDLALVQLVGMLSGTASSICLATPMLVDFKMRQRPYQQQAAKVLARREQRAAKRAAAAQRGTAGGQAGGNRPVEQPGDDTAGPPDDDESIVSELRQEKAMAAAASVPARTAKRSDTRRKRPSGKRRR